MYRILYTPNSLQHKNLAERLSLPRIGHETNRTY